VAVVAGRTFIAMGRRGPPPQPTALRLLSGRAAHRPVHRNEPRPDPPETLEPPASLEDVAREEWHRVVSQAAVMGYSVWTWRG